MKFNKKYGFSILELSIVFVAMGLLISVILISKTIVKNATYTSIINKMQNYEKAINLFYITYSEFPGNLDQSQCSLIDRFASNKIQNTNHSICDNNEMISTTIEEQKITGYGWTNKSCVNCNISGGANSFQSDTQAVFFLTISGLIDNSYNLIIPNTSKLNPDQDTIKAFYPKYIDIYNIGFITLNTTENIFGQRKEIIANKNSYIYQNLYNQSQVTFFNIGEDDNIDGFITSDDAEIIDIKIDDGKPYTGMFFSFKSGYGQNDLENSKNYCTTLNLNQNIVSYHEINNAKYSSYQSSSKKYGCNITLKIKTNKNIN